MTNPSDADMAQDLSRQDQAQRFLAKAGWAEAIQEKVPGDASTRSYTRLTKENEKAILMDAPLGAETATCPPKASPKERRALGYNAEARLAGPNLQAFISISDALCGAGISAPKVLAYDVDQGFALLQDLGDGLIAHEIAQGASEEPLYLKAADVLIRLQSEIRSPEYIKDHIVLDYDETAMLAEVNLLPEWYVPFASGEGLSAEAQQEYETAWRTVLANLSAPHTLVLRDYHAENLLSRPAETDLAQMGVIDFQDALFGHGAYDLVSLLEDARRDVSPQVILSVYDYFITSAKMAIAGFDVDQFEKDYAILAAQRNAKIVGIFARLIKRDKKEKYHAFLPRIIRLFAADLQRPGLEPVKNWVETHAAELLTAPSDFVSPKIKTAMVLAAGLGTRMRPLTDKTPKPLIKVSNKPLIDYTLDRFAAAGVGQAVVNVHYLADQIEAHTNDYTAMKINISDERGDVLETGGGLLKAKETLGACPIFCTNTDAILFDTPGTESCARLSDAWQDAEMDALLLLCRKDQASGYPGQGDFLLGADGRLSWPDKTKPVSDDALIFTGLQIIHPRLFAHRAVEKISTVEFWKEAMANGRLFGLVHDGFWMHVGDPEGLQEAEEWIERGVFT